jgi:predicted metal-dependent hydrolase
MMMMITTMMMIIMMMMMIMTMMMMMVVVLVVMIMLLSCDPQVWNPLSGAAVTHLREVHLNRAIRCLGFYEPVSAPETIRVLSGGDDGVVQVRFFLWGCGGGGGG